MYCVNCGTAADTNGNFCAKCGKPLSKNIAETIPSASQAPSISNPKTPSVLWLYLLGLAILGTYAAAFIPAFAGQRAPPNAGMGFLVWTSLFVWIL
jgi:hypothetical protein